MSSLLKRFSKSFSKKPSAQPQPTDQAAPATSSTPAAAPTSEPAPAVAAAEPSPAAKESAPTPSAKMPAKIAVLVYSTYGHVAKLSESVVEGLKAAGAEYKVFQIAETLSEEVLGKLHANKAPTAHLPVVQAQDLVDFDGIVFGFPTRYGRAPAQVSAFFDTTGGLWAKGALVGKFATIFTSTGGQHGGLESTALTTLPFLVHQGIAYVPYGYQAPEQHAVDHVIGSSAYGAGTVAGGQGQLQPDANDLTVAKKQGEYFANFVGTYVKGKQA